MLKSMLKCSSTGGDSALPSKRHAIRRPSAQRPNRAPEAGPQATGARAPRCDDDLQLDVSAHVLAAALQAVANTTAARSF